MVLPRYGHMPGGTLSIIEASHSYLLKRVITILQLAKTHVHESGEKTFLRAMFKMCAMV